MPWQEVSTMSLRTEFVHLAQAEDSDFAELCRRFGISRKTGYKWVDRFEAEGAAGLCDRSKRPNTSPRKSSQEIEAAVLAIREAHPAWGGRKIRARLQALGKASVPSASTITAILRRHGLLTAEESLKHQAWTRFEHEEPNRLWQMDFKGDFALGTGRCYPLTIIDDHSRFSICLKACANQLGHTVQSALVEVFRRYGLPERMSMDNGAPWGGDKAFPYTTLTAWLIRLGVRVGHSRPYHPQTQGKDERFHRTLNAEVLRYQVFRDLAHCQDRFDDWRDIYNLERPHEALGMTVPASRYRPSWRAYPEALPEIEYAPGDIVRKVQGKGEIHYRNRVFIVGQAFKGQPVALRPTLVDGKWEVYYCHALLTVIDLRESSVS